MPPPKTITCYLCGQQFGQGSIKYHYKACYTKAYAEWERIPKSGRGLPPTHPDEYQRQQALVQQGTKPSRGKNQQREQPPHPASANSHTQSTMAAAQPTVVGLPQCRYCNRRFGGGDRLLRHEAVCQSRPENSNRRRVFNSRKQRLQGVSEEDPDDFVQNQPPSPPAHDKDAWKSSRSQFLSTIKRDARSRVKVNKFEDAFVPETPPPNQQPQKGPTSHKQRSSSQPYQREEGNTPQTQQPQRRPAAQKPVTKGRQQDYSSSQDAYYQEESDREREQREREKERERREREREREQRYNQRQEYSNNSHSHSHSSDYDYDSYNTKSGNGRDAYSHSSSDNSRRQNSQYSSARNSSKHHYYDDTREDGRGGLDDVPTNTTHNSTTTTNDSRHTMPSAAHSGGRNKYSYRDERRDDINMDDIDDQYYDDEDQLDSHPMYASLYKEYLQSSYYEGPPPSSHSRSSERDYRDAYSRDRDRDNHREREHRDSRDRESWERNDYAKPTRPPATRRPGSAMGSGPPSGGMGGKRHSSSYDYYDDGDDWADSRGYREPERPPTRNAAPAARRKPAREYSNSRDWDRDREFEEERDWDDYEREYRQQTTRYNDRDYREPRREIRPKQEKYTPAHPATRRHQPYSSHEYAANSPSRTHHSSKWSPSHNY
eukprot:TRINITY_DN66977_c4_g1_i1.p1 TRINITY_DN66977_c4_g1~~TRINITY_DN66977_c4_g1_i1.p1  ORF type:complete len:658 (-),score=56.27 TRINITY_DN66977_c4_g1_i1:782-2755(-)